MDIDVKLLKQLREMTGAGIVDCKNALTEANSDIDKAVTWLREKGMAKAVKKASRVSAEGVFNAVVKGNKCYVYEVNCETDFVAKNQKFLDFVDALGEVIAVDSVKCTDCALEAKNAQGQTVKEMLLGIIAVIGENITLRNVTVYEKADDEIFSVYKHNGGKLLVVVTAKGSEDAAHKIAMQVCALAPQYLDRNSVDQEYLAKEKEILTKEAMENNPGKPAQILEKMVEGRISKELKEICLMDQIFFVDGSITVQQYLEQTKSSVSAYSRHVVGEGVEKKANDFVSEVMSQMK